MSAEDVLPPDTMEIEKRAAEWVADRRNAEDWTAERQTELDAWLARSLAHRVAYLRIDATWNRTDRLAALRRPMRAQTSREHQRKLPWARIAAVFGLVVVSGIFATNYMLAPKGKLVETPKGGQERLTLVDGSHIELNTDTAIRIDYSENKRAITLLRGEAYFQVRHDAARPFSVAVAGHRIVDLGTKFVVRMAPKSFQVALLEGSARLENENGAQGRAIVLSPGDVAVATATATKVTRRPEHELTERLAWQHGAIVFHNQRLADAVAEFNRYGGPRLVLSGDIATRLKINGTFRTDGAADFAALTHEIFGLQIQRRDGAIFLTR